MSESSQPEAPSSQPKSRRRGLSFLVVVGLLLAATVGVYVGATVDFKPKPKLAIVTNNEDAFWEPVIRGAQIAAEEAKVDLTVVRSKPGAEAQSQHLRELVAQGIQGIAVSVSDPRAEAAVLDEGAAKAVLFTFDSDAPESKRRLFVGTDDYAAGQAAGREVRAALPEGGEVIITVGSVEMVNGRLRRQGVIDELLGRPFQFDRPADPLDAELKGERYSVVATVVHENDAAKAPPLLAAAIKAHPQVKCIVGLFGYSAPAALKAIEQTGSKGIKIVGFDDLDETQAGVEDGTIYSSILQDQHGCGYYTVHRLADAVRATTVDQKALFLIPFVNILRRDNLRSLRADGSIRQPGFNRPPSTFIRPPSTWTATAPK